MPIIIPLKDVVNLFKKYLKKELDNENDNIKFSIDLFFLRIEKINSIVKIYKSIINDTIYTENDKKLLLEKYMKIKYALKRLKYFSRKCFWYYSKIYDIQTDLYFKSLDNYPTHQKIKLNINKTIYHFRISDLINIWMKKLKHNEGLFSKPLKIKNPYTNVIFKKHHLYTIYFKIMESNFLIPHIITLFFYSEFNIQKLKYENHAYLKDITIEEFVENGTIYDKYEQIVNMIYEFKTVLNNIVFRENISFILKSRVCRVMKPYLKIYLISAFSCNPVKKHKNYLLIKRKLTKFFKEFPNFGLDDMIIIKDAMVTYNENNMTRRPRRNAITNIDSSSASIELPNVSNSIINYNPFTQLLQTENQENVNSNSNPMNIINISETINRYNRDVLLSSGTRNIIRRRQPPPPPADFLRTLNRVSLPNISPPQLPPPPPPPHTIEEITPLLGNNLTIETNIQPIENNVSSINTTETTYYSPFVPRNEISRTPNRNRNTTRNTTNNTTRNTTSNTTRRTFTLGNNGRRSNNFLNYNRR